MTHVFAFFIARILSTAGLLPQGLKRAQALCIPPAKRMALAQAAFA